MWLCIFLVFACIRARHVLAGVVNIDAIPKWPSAYNAKGVMKLPYSEISEPFEVWYNEEEGVSRVDYYNGSVKTYQLSKEGKFGTYYKFEPVLSTIECFKTEGTLQKKVLPQKVLPDMTGYKFKGKVNLRGVEAEMWQKELLSETTYTVYLYWKEEANKKTIVPLRYDQEGTDHHYMDFEYFSATLPTAATFQIKNKKICKPMNESELVGVEEQFVYSFNPIQEFLDESTDHIDGAWDNYKKQFNKNYSPEEDSLRKNIFCHEMRYITSTNRANLSYSLSVNHLVDYTPEERQALTACAFRSNFYGGDELEETNNTLAKLPITWDWRTKGAVTPVKDQGECGSCWSFSATGAIEGAYFKKTGRLVRLSEQALVDCSWNYGNKGCDGGYMTGAFKWVKDKGGIPSAQSYGPYRAAPNFCHVKRGMRKVRISTYGRVKKLCPSCIKQALLKYGPISVGLHVNKDLLYYKRGIYNNNSCPKNKMNHAVLIVGYNKMQGQEFWIVKNSWSNQWGLSGYALIGIKGNICGIMQDPTCVMM